MMHEYLDDQNDIPIEDKLPKTLHSTADQNLDENQQKILMSTIKIDPTHCNHIWNDWIKSLWFTPTGFKKQSLVPDIKTLLIPFYLWDAKVTSEYSGDIGKYFYNNKDNKQQVPGNINSVKDTLWHHATDIREIYYHEFAVCASLDETVVELISKMPRLDFKITLEPKSPLELHKKGYQVHLPVEQRKSWELVRRVLEEKEHHECEEKLKDNHDADILNNFKIITQFVETEAKLVYFPFYFSSSMYDNKNILFIMNGHTGEYHGERPPIGLGKLGDFGNEMKDFINTIVGNKEKEGICTGEELAKIDHINIYDPQLSYLTFARSNSYLLHQSVGFIKLKNESPNLIVLEGQKRKERIVSKYKIRLEPYIETKLPYRGHWCFAIMSGDKDSIKVIKVQTTGGDNIKDIYEMTK